MTVYCTLRGQIKQANSAFLPLLPLATRLCPPKMSNSMFVSILFKQYRAPVGESQSCNTAFGYASCCNELSPHPSHCTTCIYSINNHEIHHGYVCIIIHKIMCFWCSVQWVVKSRGVLCLCVKCCSIILLYCTLPSSW